MSYAPASDYLECFMLGQCAAWALAHQQQHPHLRFGLHWERLSDEDSIEQAEEDGEEWDGEPVWQVQHVFTHDDHYAYDASGKHALPYLAWDDTATGIETAREIEMTGMVEYGYIDEALDGMVEYGDPLHLPEPQTASAPPAAA